MREQISFWGVIPYERYSILNAITGAGGGLEHKASTLLMTNRWRTRTREGYLRWLFLVSHEFFHAWNVKRRITPLLESSRGTVTSDRAAHVRGFQPARLGSDAGSSDVGRGHNCQVRQLAIPA